jgi:hypothetical protein
VYEIGIGSSVVAGRGVYEFNQINKFGPARITTSIVADGKIFYFFPLDKYY